ncbi:hypothetical protein AGMMS50267_15100 [Spirochaetia bacterium]|nr:hypothetical protein AGMMS50267_15100 [Spirochaetia bacterium]
MTIEQTVDIPVDHRLTLEIPREIPAGKTILALTLIPIPIIEKSRAEFLHLGSVEYTRKKNNLPVVTQEMLDEMFEGSITQSLTGILHLPDMTPEEIRSERLRKYERID